MSPADWVGIVSAVPATIVSIITIVEGFRRLRRRGPAGASTRRETDPPSLGTGEDASVVRDPRASRARADPFTFAVNAGIASGVCGSLALVGGMLLVVASSFGDVTAENAAGVFVTAVTGLLLGGFAITKDPRRRPHFRRGRWLLYIVMAAAASGGLAAVGAVSAVPPDAVTQTSMASSMPGRERRAELQGELSCSTLTVRNTGLRPTPPFFVALISNEGIAGSPVLLVVPKLAVGGRAALQLPVMIGFVRVRLDPLSQVREISERNQDTGTLLCPRW